LALVVPLSRFTPRVGGGSAFFVRPLDLSMTKLAYIVFFPAILIVFSGCSIHTGYSSAFSGKCAVTQSDAVISIQAEALSSFFTLTAAGNEKQPHIDAIQGKYQYGTNSIHPLRLYYLKQDRATFIPTEDLFISKSPQGVVQSRLMKDGHYKFAFDYTINGQTNACDFDVHLTTKKRLNVIWIWEFPWGLGGAPGG